MNSDDVKKAVARTLLINFPNVEVYKEAKTNPKYPHFFINQVNVQDEEERKNHHILTYLLMIRYRLASDPTTNLSLQTDLDNIGFKLLECFNMIPLDRDVKLRCYDKSIEKIDGVLHFSFNVDVHVIDDNGDIGVKMNRLNVKSGVVL